jgi:hypothetical protein
MKSFGMVCLLFGCASWGQAVNSGAAQADQGAIQPFAEVKAVAGPLGHVSPVSKGAPDKPVITISGLCDNPADKVAAPGCKTVITQGQFEGVIDALQPGMRVHARREFALHYAEVLVMAREAEKMGLDQGPSFEEQMKLARIQILSQALRKAVQAKVAQIPNRDVEDFYRSNAARFEKAELDRIYIPKTRQTAAACDNKLTDDERKGCSQESDQTMKMEADRLRERAIAGEEFAVLQTDAYHTAGIKSPTPGTNMWVRRISLPPDQISVMDLAPGEISPVFADSNGYFLYRVKAKAMISLDQANDEIKEALRTQRAQDEMRNILDATPSTIDESYFVR